MSATKNSGLAKLVRTLAIVALLIGMAWTNPGKEKLESKFGERFQSSANFVVFTLAFVTPLPGSPLELNNEEKIKTHQTPTGLGTAEYHIGIFGQVF